MTNSVAQYSLQLQNLARSLAWSGPLLMRVVFGYFWLETGWAKLHNLEGFAGRFLQWGIPYPEFSAALSAGAEFVGGGLLMLGLLTRFASLTLLINMIVALLVVVIKDVADLDAFVELDEVVYILIFWWLIVAGPGKVSLDALIARKLGLPAQPA